MDGARSASSAPAGYAAAGRIDPVRDWQPEHLVYSIPEALKLIADIPPIDRLVVCHGDSARPTR